MLHRQQRWLTFPPFEDGVNLEGCLETAKSAPDAGTPHRSDVDQCCEAIAQPTINKQEHILLEVFSIAAKAQRWGCELRLELPTPDRKCLLRRIPSGRVCANPDKRSKSDVHIQHLP